MCITSSSLLTFQWLLAAWFTPGRKIEEVARKAAPKVCFEMGTYVGVSAIAVARHMPPNGRLITTEFNAKYAEVAKELVRFAGLDQVKKKEASTITLLKTCNTGDLQ